MTNEERTRLEEIAPRCESVTQWERIYDKMADVIERQERQLDKAAEIIERLRWFLKKIAGGECDCEIDPIPEIATEARYLLGVIEAGCNLQNAPKTANISDNESANKSAND